MFRKSLYLINQVFQSSFPFQEDVKVVQRKDSLRPRKVMRGLTIDSSQLGKTLSNVFTHTRAKIISPTSVQIFLRQFQAITYLSGITFDRFISRWYWWSGFQNTRSWSWRSWYRHRGRRILIMKFKRKHLQNRFYEYYVLSNVYVDIFLPCNIKILNILLCDNSPRSFRVIFIFLTNVFLFPLARGKSCWFLKLTADITIPFKHSSFEFETMETKNNIKSLAGNI